MTKKLFLFTSFEHLNRLTALKLAKAVEMIDYIFVHAVFKPVDDRSESEAF